MWIKKNVVAFDSKNIYFYNFFNNTNSSLYLVKERRVYRDKDSSLNFGLYKFNYADSNLKKIVINLSNKNYYSNRKGARFFTSTAIYYYDDSKFIRYPFTKNSNSFNFSADSVTFKKGNIIGLTTPVWQSNNFNNKIFLIKEDSSKSQLSICGFQDEFMPSDSVDNQVIPYPFPGLKLNRTNTAISSILNNKKLYIGIVSSINNITYVSILQQDNPLISSGFKVIAQNKFPNANNPYSIIRNPQLLFTGGNMWLSTLGNIYKIQQQNDIKKGVEFNIQQIPLDYLINQSKLWFDENGFCSILNRSNSLFLFSNTVKPLFKPTKDDTASMTLMKDFTFYAYQNTAQPEFVGLSNDVNKVLVRVRRPYTGKMQISVIGDIQWEDNPFTVISNVDYYYIIILTAFFISLYFIGFSLIRVLTLIPAPPSKAIILIPTLGEKMNGIRSAAEVLQKRSNLMLILGIVFGTGGVIVAYILFTTTGSSIDSSFNPKTTVNILRPVMLLVFIETFTFFFLKQYRVVFNEYKLFYSVYLKLFNYLHILELTVDGKEKKKMIGEITTAFLKEKYELYEKKATASIKEFEHPDMLKLLEAAAKLK